MADEGNHEGRERSANDNRTPDGQNVGADASERLDAVVLSIARLIGKQMAREDFAARIAANDNRKAKAADDD
ncbi:hypothetical protein DUT91_20410 [Phyllobacterium salinisoli]|uniref:Uncharacterized protein n=1 Tax=Phyllobacterium salinisoli TaxID=1899321 RepID=A0A368JY63_9HYPH|nr:hypothetical protein [Phyllobacterium salinisoli]RCS22079.1 hypothetical protein DUT91_20410 [Phyllobacterium salinisoli]